ncbi:hypothetical protein JXB28_04895 [Candidatus Woesearchaeota archaeon]|nr:hypothetical protein [Candidatus Woesearchaeota archaeon]
MGRRERKSDKKKQIAMSIVISALMIFSVFGIFLGTQSNELRYGKFKLTYNEVYPNARYVLKVDKQEIPLYFLPQETELINLSSSTTNKIKEAVFVTTAFQPNSTSLAEIALVNLQLSLYLKDSQGNNKIINQAILTESPDYELPVVSCANASLQTPVIVFNMSDVPSIVDDNNCIYFNARGLEYLRLRDRLVYSYYGVIQDE